MVMLFGNYMVNIPYNISRYQIIMLYSPKSLQKSVGVLYSLAIPEFRSWSILSIDGNSCTFLKYENEN
jgi:hypothetical protein